MIYDLIAVKVFDSIISKSLRWANINGSGGYWYIPGRHKVCDIHLHSPGNLSEMEDCPDEIASQIFDEFDMDDDEDAWVISYITPGCTIALADDNTVEVIDDNYFWVSKFYYERPIWIESH